MRSQLIRVIFYLFTASLGLTFYSVSLKSQLVDTKIVSDFFNEKGDTEDKSMFGIAALLGFLSQTK